MDVEQQYWNGMFVRRAGSGGQPLVFIHGLGESGNCWEGVIGRSALSHFQQLVPDLPSYGRSLWRPQPATVSELADRMAALVSQFCREPAILIGHSMGGVIAQLLCERHSDLVAGLINVEGNLSLEDCTNSLIAAEAGDSAAFSGGGFQRLLASLYAQGGQDPVIRDYFASVRFCDPRSFYLNSCELVEASRLEDLAVRLSRLPFPTLYIAGLRDRPGRHSLNLLAESKVNRVEFQSSGHWPFLDEPDRFCARLLEFCSSVNQGLG